MSFSSAIGQFQEVINNAEDQTSRAIGEGLLELTKTLRTEVDSIKNDLRKIKNDVSRIPK